MINRSTIIIVASIGIILFDFPLAAQKVPRVAKKLPPPPPIPTVTRSPACNNCGQTIPVTPASSNIVREYVFQAPNTKPAVVSGGSRTQPISRPNTTTLYRVEVIGKDRELLSKVKKIEPLAFIRVNEGVIQAGLFGQQQQAQQRVNELKTQGFSARVVSITR